MRGALRLSVVLACLAAAPAAQAVCTLPAEHAVPPRAPGAARPPLVIGDSTMIYALPELARLGVEADARSCRGFPEVVALIRARRAQHRLPPIVGIGVGAGWPYFTGDVERVLRLIGPHRRLALITHRKRGGAPSEDTRSLRLAAARHPRQVILVDWVRDSAGKRSRWFYPDGLHVTPRGGLAYARFIAATLRLAERQEVLRLRCFPKGAHGLLETEALSVYRLRAEGHFACLFATGRRQFMDDEGTQVRGPIAAAGAFVVYGSRLGGATEPPETAVSVVDLDPRSELGGGPSSLILGPEAAVPRVTAVVVAPGGSFAWIAEHATSAGPEYEVARHRAGTPSGTVESLTRSASVAPHSLKLQNGRLSWTQNGRPRRAALPY